MKRSIPFYIYAFSRRFYPKRITVHSGYTYFFVSMFVLWELNPQPFALLTQCSTTEPQEHLLSLSHKYPLTYLIKTILDCFISCCWFVHISLLIQMRTFLMEKKKYYGQRACFKTLMINWSGVDCCDVFISCLDCHSDGTHSQQKIHWWTG